MLPSWCQESVTVTRAGSRESRGTTVQDWSSATTHVVAGCSVQLPTTSMDLDGRQQTMLAGTVYAPCGADMRAGDRISWTDSDGVSHDALVEGEPMAWRSPTGRVSHVQARIVEWRG